MGHVNVRRMIVGALVAAVILFVIEDFINGSILGEAWESWAKGLGPTYHAPPLAIAMVIWAIVSLLHGVTGLMIYASIRPRFGAGPKTALLAALLLWIPGFLTHALSQLALGDIPHRIIAIGCIGGLVAVAVAIVAGAATYQEP
jgi:hypothetical protein